MLYMWCLRYEARNEYLRHHKIDVREHLTQPLLTPARFFNRSQARRKALSLIGKGDEALLAFCLISIPSAADDKGTSRYVQISSAISLLALPVKIFKLFGIV